MSLLRYQDVLPWAAGIRREVLERRMPPWSPEEGHLELRGARLLSAVEIDVLADWVTGATPEGDVALDPLETPPPRHGLEGETLLTLRLEPVRLGPDESRKTACRVMEVALGEHTWLTGAELAPGAPHALRRAQLWKGRHCADDAAPLMVWLPGQAPLELPPGSGEPLAPGQPLALRLEYQKAWNDDGRVVEDASELRLRLDPGPPRREPRRRAADGEPLPGPADLLALSPVSAGAGPVEVVALRPGAEPAVLLELRRPDPLWLGRYELAEPLRLPAGTRLRARGGPVFAELLPDP
jgi:hypothetical protein